VWPGEILGHQSPTPPPQRRDFAKPLEASMP
jgi:hypothetical protein